MHCRPRRGQRIWAAPSLTAEKFLDNPFIERGYDHPTTTGDLAKIDETGRSRVLEPGG